MPSMVTAARFREIALSLEGAYEAPHMERTAFRTKRRIFATMPPDGASINLMLAPEQQEALCEALPDALSPVPGGWGRMGATTCDLRVVSEEDLVGALTEAHERASLPNKKPAAKKAPRARKR
jgi:hypothetical protein